MSGATLKKLHAALMAGSTQEADAALKPILDKMVLDISLSDIAATECYDPPPVGDRLKELAIQRLRARVADYTRKQGDG